jgi:hypothetical protein
MTGNGVNIPVKPEPYPYFICRVAGLPINKIEKLRFNYTYKLLDEYFNAEKEVKQYCQLTSDLIYNSIVHYENKKIRAKLLSLRRDLFNNRSNIDCCKSVLDIVDSELKTSLNGLIEKLGYQRLIYCKYLKSYEIESKNIRQNFVKLLQEEDFQKGLLLSSQSLFNTQRIYFKVAEYQKLNKKIEQLERGLLRYFTRMTMKATPFGTFCTILPGKIDDNLNGFTVSYKGNLHKKSLLLINKGLFTGLSHYLTKNEVIKKSINLELNPTIKTLSDQLLFLTDIEGKEVFQRLINNPILDLLRKELFKHKKITYCNLINFIVKNEQFETTEEEVAVYLEKLIEIGFIKYNIGIPSQEIDWDKILVSILDGIDDDHARKISNILDTVQKNICEYRKANINLRSNILERTTSLINEITEEYSLESNLKADLPFYEDSTADCKIYLNKKQFGNIFAHLSSFIQITSKLALPRRENVTMRNFFDHYYLNSHEEIFLLQFFEDYYREHFKKHIEKMQEYKSENGNTPEEKYNYPNPLNIDLIERISAAFADINQTIVAKWQENKYNEEIHINMDDIKKAISMFLNAALMILFQYLVK